MKLFYLDLEDPHKSTSDPYSEVVLPYPIGNIIF